MAERASTTVLVVDDESDMRMLVRVVIDLANYGITIVGEARDGAQAITTWRALDGPPDPDVIVLDNRMPHMTGLEVAERILAERPDQLIVLYSAFLDEQIRASAAALGITECVQKEDLQHLPDIIQRVAVGVLSH